MSDTKTEVDGANPIRMFVQQVAKIRSRIVVAALGGDGYQHIAQ